MNSAIVRNGETYVLRGGGPVYRIWAHPSQVPLIRQLSSRHRVELCSVSLLNAAGAPFDQNCLEYLAGPLTLPAGAGGPRPLSAGELAALELASVSDQELLEYVVASPDKSTILGAIERHPAVRSGLGFAFNTMLNFSLIRVLRMVYDIRRFGSLAHPGRMGRFKMFFRLASPRLFFALYKHGGPPDTELLDRTGALVASWVDHPFYHLTVDGLSNPERFLFREYKHRRSELGKVKNSEEAEVLSVWQTSARLGAFIYRLWVHGVGDTSFAPELFFNRQDEVDEFKKYIKTLDKRGDGFTKQSGLERRES